MNVLFVRQEPVLQTGLHLDFMDQRSANCTLRKDIASEGSMPDSATIGSIAAAALAMGAEVALKAGVGEAIKDAYKALKDCVSKWAQPELNALEGAPTSKGKQLAVAEVLDSAPPDETAEIRLLVAALQRSLRDTAASGAIAIDTEKLEADSVRLREIDISSGTGIRAKEIKVSGEFSMENLRVGKQKR